MKNILFTLLILSHSSFSQKFNADKVLNLVEILSHDSLEGRKTGTSGNLKAGKLMVTLFEEYGLERQGNSFNHPFSKGKIVGQNIVGKISGSVKKNQYILISAHYDHLGRVGNEIFNGADDNASGVGGLIGLIDYFKRNPPHHSILFVAFDGEEIDLSGSDAFVKNPPVSLDSIILNINMDMISRSSANKLIISGTHHYPFLKKYLPGATSNNFSVVPGHDNKANKSEDDWTFSSDHAPFHKKGIPFLYFGVEDHEDYHKATDDFEKIDKEFYLKAITFIIDTVQNIDKEM